MHDPMPPIAAVLRQQPGVFEAVALGWPVEGGVPQGIVAFVTGKELDPGALHEAVRERLPAYMIPQSIYVFQELPLSTHGKVDLPALLAL
jgi:acyl-CoA synthetase (AMP-forming)/AMP-acid ligase II